MATRHLSLLPQIPLLAAASLLIGFVAPQRLAAQEAREEGSARIVPTHNFVLTGYGTVGYNYRPQGDNANEFTARFAPVFLYQFQDKILFEAELEFELEDGVTATGLEYAQVDYIANDNLVLIAGKFLLPFGVFGERIHPSWINKFPTTPPIFGHDETGFGVRPLLPIMSDVGAMARATIRPGPTAITLNAYLTNGPAGEEGDHDALEPEFPASSSDNNSNKMFGGRLDVALPPQAEVNFSYFNGAYDEDNRLDFSGWNVAAEYHARNFEARGEYVQTRQQLETLETLKRHGLYTQAAYRIGAWEPVLRWSQIFDSTLGGDVEDLGAWQAGLALDYWFSASIALMAGYEINREKDIELDNDRIVVHVAFGF